MSNQDLLRTQKLSNNCFYTQMQTIEEEMQYHKNSFKNKVVFCGCNDGKNSNFWKYFSQNYEELKLKGLITTSYSPNGQGYKLEMYDEKNVLFSYLKGTGDITSPECLLLLMQCDIFVTNVPFSKFRIIFKLLQEYQKKFLIIGSLNSLAYKDVFPYFQNNKVWLGYSIKNGGRHFNIPDFYPIETSSGGVEKTGERYIRVKAVRWITNLDYKERYETLPITKEYVPGKYEYYDNLNAINVDSLKDIPRYNGVLGVPLTILDHFNPQQIQILGFNTGENKKILSVNGKRKYCRVLIGIKYFGQ